MIEINLSPTKKAAGIANVGGIDLSQINVKMMIIALLIWFVPEPVLMGILDDEKAGYEKEFQKLNTEFKKLQGTVKSMDNVQKQVDALKEQEEKLALKLQTVKEIINKRQNPYEVLLYITKNIPADVWLTSINIDENNLVIRGYAKTWKNIGDFLEALKSSIFFSKTVDYQRPGDMSPDYRGQRVEVFEIKTSIVRFK